MISSASRIESHNFALSFEPKKTIPSQKIDEFVKNFVAAFLHPYIAGYITQETEPQDRKPMMKELFSELEKKFPKDCINKELETVAYDHYLFCATQGLYVNCKKDCGELIDLESEEYKILFAALQEALPKDFPQKTVSEEEFKKQVTDTLEKVNRQRLRDYQEFLSKPQAVISRARREKIKETLKSSGSLFIETSTSSPHKNPLEPLKKSIISYIFSRLFPSSLTKISSTAVAEISGKSS